MAAQTLFGTTGIRGDAKELFTDQFSFDLGRTFAIFLKNEHQVGKVAVGIDPRESSPRIRAAYASGLIYEGFEVFDEGVAPIPAMNYILKAEPSFAGSTMVSGSHIKPHLNGLKFFAFGEEIQKDHEAKIDKIYADIKENVKYLDKSEIMVPDDSAPGSYQDYLVSKAKLPYPAWKVVVDPGNGAQSDVAPWVLRQLGLDVIELNASVQGEFYSRDTEVEGDFKGLQETVITEKADFGIGFDSDGDRAVFIDEKGSYVPGDYTGALLAKEAAGEFVVTPINTSQVVEETGKKVVRTKVGSSHVVAKMKEVGASFGFEANGGGIFSDMLSRDGGRTAVEVLNILADRKGTFSDFVATLPKYFLARDKVEYEWSLKDEIIWKAKEAFKGVKTEEIDGLKIWQSESTWILFRSSLNAPEFRVFAESKDKEEAEKLLKEGLELVRKIVEK
jgi:phosphomannomutase/phosphoglucomutase